MMVVMVAGCSLLAADSFLAAAFEKYGPPPALQPPATAGWAVQHSFLLSIDDPAFFLSRSAANWIFRVCPFFDFGA